MTDFREADAGGGWRIVCVSCQGIISARDARPILILRGEHPAMVSLFGCPRCHQEGRAGFPTLRGSDMPPTDSDVPSELPTPFGVGL